MTDVEILKAAIEKIDNVEVPLGLSDQISEPLKEASGMLKVLLEKVTQKPYNVPESAPPQPAEWPGSEDDDEEEYV